MIGRTRHGLFAALVVLASACGSADQPAQDSVSPLPVALEDAMHALTSGGIMSDCLTQPEATVGDAAVGSTGYLGCHATVAGSAGHWTIKVFAGDSESYAKAGYQRSCEAMKRVSRQFRWWAIWHGGQDWYAEVTATTGKAPRSIAEAFAHALKSTAWDDCSGLS
jgi:hypothetical protein